MYLHPYLVLHMIMAYLHTHNHNLGRLDRFHYTLHLHYILYIRLMLHILLSYHNRLVIHHRLVLYMFSPHLSAPQSIHSIATSHSALVSKSCISASLSCATHDHGASPQR